MSDQISFAVRQPILDLLHDLSELENLAIQVVKDSSALATAIATEHFTVQEVIRKELVKTQKNINSLLQTSVNEVWDNSLAQMPDVHIPVAKVNEMIDKRAAEIHNLKQAQKS